jgi:hypothetical protein
MSALPKKSSAEDEPVGSEALDAELAAYGADNAKKACMKDRYVKPLLRAERFSSSGSLGRLPSGKEDHNKGGHRDQCGWLRYGAHTV